MKKGHRRTHSETITISNHFHDQPIRKQAPLITERLHYFQQSQPFNYMINYSSGIEQLLTNSNQNIIKKIQYVENLQQPLQNTFSTNLNYSDFSFGKGVNFKLNSFRLNMREIPEVPKSNESTSLQSENTLELQENQKYLIHQPFEYRLNYQLLHKAKGNHLKGFLNHNHQKEYQAHKRTKVSSIKSVNQIESLNRVINKQKQSMSEYEKKIKQNQKPKTITPFNVPIQNNNVFKNIKVMSKKDGVQIERLEKINKNISLLDKKLQKKKKKTQIV